MPYDTIIIGAGAAGLTAGLYASRRNLKTLILSKDLGGQTTIATEIENYPGVINRPNGFELMQTFKKQAENSGSLIKLEQVIAVNPQKNIFNVKTEKNNYQTKTIILALGLSHRELNIPGEKELRGKGVAYCATCDAPLFKNKTVAVVGGGNSALDAADLLSGIAKRVYLIHRGDKFTAETVLQKAIKKTKNIEILLNSEVKTIKGKDKVESIVVGTKTIPSCQRACLPARQGGKGGVVEKEQELKLDGIFIEIGYSPKTDWLGGLIELNGRGEIITDENCRTSVPGIFAAGDVTDAPYKQIVISAGEGAKAALQAYNYLEQREGLKEVPDWGKNR